MNKTLLTLALVSAASTSSVIAAPAMPTVYGKIFITVDKNSQETNDSIAVGDVNNKSINSRSSRIGFKGAEKIADDFAVIYKVEIQVDATEKTNTFKNRNTYVGLKGAWGTVLAGTHDTPLKMSQGRVEQFSDVAGDLGAIFAGEQRQADALMYKTPSMSGFSLTTMVSPGEDNNGDGTASDGTDRDGLADYISLSANYKLDNLYLAAAFDKGSSKGKLAAGSSGFVDIARVVATYKIAAVELGALYQIEKDATTGGTEEASGFLVSAAYKLSNRVKLKVQAGLNEADISKRELETQSIGADYGLSKRTKLTSYYGVVTDTTGSIEKKTTGLGVGIVHKF